MSRLRKSSKDLMPGDLRGFLPSLGTTVYNHHKNVDAFNLKKILWLFDNPHNTLSTVALNSNSNNSICFPHFSRKTLVSTAILNLFMDIPAFEELFKQIKLNLWLMGIPYDDFKFKFRYIFFFFCMCVMIVAEFLFLVSKISAENLLELTQLAPCTCIGILSALKFLAIMMKRQKIYHLTESLKQLYNVMENDVEKAALIRSEIIFLKSLVKYFFILNWILISVYNFSSPILIVCYYLMYKEVHYILPYAVLLPFEVDGWLPWSFVYIHSCLCGFICTLYFTTVDVLYCLLTSQICGNFTIISNKFKMMNVANAAVLQEIVKEHQYVLKLADDLEDIFTAPNLFNVLVGSIEICALGFNLTIGDWKQIPGCILFLASVLLQILMMSVFGENIIRESKNIGEAAYTSKWYEMDERSKKTILTILTRSAKPQKLTAYKFSVISYGSFSKIISTSWSYFTILRTVYTPPTKN